MSVVVGKKKMVIILDFYDFLCYYNYIILAVVAVYLEGSSFVIDSS